MENRAKTLFLLLVIVALATFFRFYKITSSPPGLYPDEAMNGNNALEAITTGEYKIFYPENNGREGLFINIQALFLKILLPLNNFNPEPWMLRIPSALFGILTVIGVFFLTKELFKKTDTALIAAFLVAISFWPVNFSRIGFRAIMAPTFLIWSIYLLLKAVKPERKALLSAAVGGVLYGLGFHSYIAYRATPLLIFGIVLYYFLKSRNNWWQKKLFINISLFAFTTMIAILPLAIHFIQTPADFFGRTTQISVLGSNEPLKELGLNILKTAGMFNISGDYNWRHNISGRPLLFWPTGIFFLVSIALGIIFFIKKQNIRGHGILFGWIIISSLPVIVSNEGLPHALRALLMMPPVFMIAAFGMNWFFEKFKSRQLKNIFAVLFVLLLIGEAYSSYFKTWSENQETKNAFSQNFVLAGKELRTIPQEMPKYVIVESNGVLVREIPMPAQTVMFLTNTFQSEKRIEKNLFYLPPSQINLIPEGGFVIKI